MPVNTKHPDYAWQEPHLKKCRDAAYGSRTIKDALNAGRYLIRLRGETDTDFEIRVERALWFGACEMTVEAMTGLATRKPPRVEIPESAEYMLDMAFGEAWNLQAIIVRAVEAVLVGGYAWHVVDVGGKGNLPFVETYSSLEVINWRISSHGVIDMAMIERTSYVQDPDDKYTLLPVTAYLELLLDEGIYKQRLWTQTETKEWVFEETIPTRGGDPLNFVPVYLSGHVGQKPPIEALADVNISHYRNSADYEEGSHLTALPKPYVIGASESEMVSPFILGAKTAWKTTNDNAKVGFLEFSGQGLKSLLEIMKSKEALMAALGARMIEPQRAGVEAAETARIHQAGRNATLADVVGDVERGLSSALATAAWWAGTETDAFRMEMSRDFISHRLDAQEIVALVKTYQAGGLSLEAFVRSLQAGERLPRDVNIDDELERIRAENPDLLAEMMT